MDELIKKDLNQATEELDSEESVVQVVKGEISDMSLRSVAKVKARLKAYEAVYENYQTFITTVAGQLSKNEFQANTYKEMSVARLVATWIIDTEAFLNENEEYLYGIERETRSKFVEDSLSGFADDIKEMLLDKLKHKKHELLEWFAKELQLAHKITIERKKAL